MCEMEAYVGVNITMKLGEIDYDHFDWNPFLRVARLL